MRHAVGLLTRLEGGLRLQPGISLLANSGAGGALGSRRELRHREHALTVELGGLVATHARDLAEVVVGEPDRIAALGPVAYRAVLDGVRIGLVVELDVPEEAGPQAAHVGVEVSEPQAFGLTSAEHNFHVRRLALLSEGEQLAVEGQAGRRSAA